MILQNLTRLFRNVLDFLELLEARYGKDRVVFGPRPHPGIYIHRAEYLTRAKVFRREDLYLTSFRAVPIGKDAKANGKHRVDG